MHKAITILSHWPK